MHQLPKPYLAPLLPTWSSEWRRINRDCARFGPVWTAQEVRALRSEAIDCQRERPWRIMNQRARIHAVYWALRPDYYLMTRNLIRTPLSRRHGTVRPKWIGCRP